MKQVIFTIAGLVFASGLAAQTGQEELSTRYNQYGVKVDRNPLTAEERSGILVFEDAKETYKFWFDCRLQMDGAYYFGYDKSYNPIGNGLRARRVRFAVKTQIGRDWYGEIDANFAGGAFDLEDAIIRYDGICNTAISLGNFKEDFSMSETTTSRYEPFMERSAVVSAFAPSRHLGVDINFQRNWFYWTSGVFFQAVDNLVTSDIVDANNKDFGRTSGPDYMSRVVFNPLYKGMDRNYGMHLGAGAVYRLPKTDVVEYGQVRYNARNSTYINRKKYMDTGLIPGFQHEFLYNGEFAAWWGGFRCQGEYISSNVYTKKTLYRFNGWYASAGYALFGGKQRYDSASAKFTQPSRGRSWGDLELMLRYDYLNLNSRDIRGGSAEDYTIGLNYYITSNVKIMVNYQYTNNDRYANGRGKLFVGHDSTGKPIADYTKIVEGPGKGGVDYNMIGMRVELDF